MAARGVLEQAENDINAGNYQKAISVLLPLVRPGAKKLPLQLERDVCFWLGTSYRLVGDKTALQYVLRWLELTQEVRGPRSVGHAVALEALCLVLMGPGLEAFLDARDSIAEALGIMEELGLVAEERYGSMLRVLGDLEVVQGHYQEALVSYEQAKAILLPYRAGHDYGALLNSMGICFEKLLQWNEAMACSKEAVDHVRHLYGNSHPQYSTALYNLAVLYMRLKQYDEATPRLGQALLICQSVYGADHERTLRMACLFADSRQHSLDARRAQSTGLAGGNNSLPEAGGAAVFQSQAAVVKRESLALEDEHAMRNDEYVPNLQGKRSAFVGESTVAVKKERLDLQERHDCALCKDPDVQRCCLVPCGHVVCYECAQQSVERGSCPFCRAACQSCMNIYSQ
jgi:tetratricopeptide (TPR) repeat protein